MPTGELVQGASRVDMLVATTRSADKAPQGEMYTGERAGLSFADISVSIPPDSARQVGEVQWPDQVPGDGAKSFVTLRADHIDTDMARKRFYERIGKAGGRVLVFVHGYNTRFEEAVYRLAQIVHDSRAPVVPVLFTWPSRGKLLAYAYDRESANYSRDALELVLQELSRNPSVKEVSVLAHSMGNWVTIEALRQMAIRDRGIHAKIKTVMLASPDVDVDVFHKQILAIGPKRPPFILFTSRDDVALSVSSRVSGATVRLGSIDPSVEPNKSLFEQERILAVDLTDVKSRDSLNHGKFAESPDVVRLIGGRLADGQQLNDMKVGLGDRLGQVAVGAVSTVGQAAGLAISAPVAIIDPQTRDNLSDRLSDLKASATSTVTSVQTPEAH